MSYSFTNADGEPIMSGDAYRFEQQLDAEYAEQAYLDQDDFDFDGDECPDCGSDECEGDCQDDEPEVSLMDEYEGPFGLWGGMDE